MVRAESSGREVAFPEGFVKNSRGELRGDHRRVNSFPGQGVGLSRCVAEHDQSLAVGSWFAAESERG